MPVYMFETFSPLISLKRAPTTEIYRFYASQIFQFSVTVFFSVLTATIISQRICNSFTPAHNEFTNYWIVHRRYLSIFVFIFYNLRFLTKRRTEFQRPRRINADGQVANFNMLAKLREERVLRKQHLLLWSR